MLRSLAGQAGGNGVYLGVGPDQNFSYIAHLRPTLAILIDIRRDNLLLHLLFKAMFSEAATKASYLALLTGRSETAATRDASIESLVRLVDQARPLGRTDLGRLEARLAAVINGFGVPLSNTDRATIARFHRRFVDAGLSLQFNSTGRLPQDDYPTYRDLLLEVDRDAVRRSFLANEDDFQFVKTLHARDRIVPIVGDLAGRDALANVGRYLDATGLRVSAFYTSNVEFYLFRDGSAQAFIANLARLPRQPGSVIVRSVFPGGGARILHGYNSASQTQPIQALLDGYQQGRFRQDRELTRRPLPAGENDAPERTPTVRPDSRDFGPTARPREGLLMMAMPHRREATWRELGDLLRRGISRRRDVHRVVVLNP